MLKAFTDLEVIIKLRIESNVVIINALCGCGRSYMS